MTGSPTADAAVEVVVGAPVGSPTPPRRPSRLRVQLVLLGVAVVVSIFGAIAWANWFGPQPPPLDARFERAGAYPISGDTGNRPVDGEPLPAAALRSADGSSTTLRSDGRPMVINLWAEDCRPCEEELKYFAAVDDAYPAEQVRFVGVNVNRRPDAAGMVEFAAARGVHYELLIDEGFGWMEALRVVALPLTLFVDADGKIVSQAGQVTEAQLRSYVGELAGPPGEPA